MRLYTRDRVRRPRMRAWIRRIIQRMRRIRRTACRFPVPLRPAWSPPASACRRRVTYCTSFAAACEVREIAQPAANARAALARAIRCTTVAARG